MFIFISAVVAGAIPQYVKLVAFRERGRFVHVKFSTEFIVLERVVERVYLHFDQIKFCIRQEVEYTIERCEASMLTLYYTLVYTLLWFCIL